MTRIPIDEPQRMIKPLTHDAEAKTSITSGRRVMEIEAQAISALADSLNGSFHDAVEAMLTARGRIIVSGMGKSGHIGRKIAATFASTGAPAQFVHPAEASHGDLGMVTKDDVALIISNSGETVELANLIAHVRRESIPLIGVASNPRSTLMRAADIPLILPKAPEACPMGLAPTTSTTMTLALGDALAVAMIERRDFRPDHFHILHPGGTLGSRLLKVEDLMHKGDELPMLPASAPMSDVILEISQKSFGVVGVTDPDGRMVGVISDGDLRRNMANLMSRRAEEVMTRTPKTVRAGALAQDAVAMMNAHKITCLFVLARGQSLPEKPVGLIHIHDCLRAGVK